MKTHQTFSAEKARVHMGDDPGVFNTSNMLNMLFSRVETVLTDTEFRYLARAVDYAEAMARHAAALTEGLALLVLCDDDKRAAVAGSFRDEQDVAALLLHLGATFDHMAGLMSVGSQAEYRLRLGEGATY